MNRTKPEDSLSLFYIESKVGGHRDPVVLRVTLGEMDLADGYYAALESGDIPPDATVRDVIKLAIENHIDEIDIKINPDLEDIRLALKDLFEEEQSDLVKISYQLNEDSRPVDPNDPYGIHLVEGEINGYDYKLLDLVLNVRESFDPLDGIPLSERNVFVSSLLSGYLLHRIGRERMRYDELKCEIQQLVSELIENGLVKLDDDQLTLTDGGKEAVELLYQEAAFYIDRYEIFGDVDLSGGAIRFNTSNGVNLIARMMEHEGLSPQRAFFVLAMYFGHLDELEDWQNQILSDDLLRGIFWDIFHSPTKEEITDDRLDEIQAAADEYLSRRRST